MTQSPQNQNTSFASVIGLGAFQSEHRPTAFNRWMNVVGSLVFVATGPALLAVAAYMYLDALNRYGSSRAMDSGFWLPLLCAVAAVPLGLFGLYQAWRNWPLAVALYEGGFAHQDRKGLKPVRWDDIDAVWQSVTRRYTNGVYTGTTYLYTVQLRDKTRIALDNKYPKIEDVGKAITVGATNTLFPRYATALRSGQRVTFGPLAMDANGLYSNNKSLQWSEIKAVKIQQGIISVKKEGGWFNWASVTVPQVPNFWIFYDLIGRFTKVE
jgi:hypothetical protein